MDEIDKLIAEVERLDRERQRLSAAAMVSPTVAKRYADLTVRAADAAPLLAAEVRRLRAELARRDALDAAWNAGAAEARGCVLHNLAADPRDHMPPEFRADEEIAAAWLAGWSADAAIVRLSEIERERDDARAALGDLQQRLDLLAADTDAAAENPIVSILARVRGLKADLKEARLTLAAEQGRQEGAPSSDWTPVRNDAGVLTGWRNCRTGAVVRAYIDRRTVTDVRFAEWRWFLDDMSGRAPTARAAMQAADAQEKV